MIFYASVFIILAVASYCELFHHVSVRVKMTFLWCAVFLFFFISAFRWNMGTDFVPYKDIFLESSIENVLSSREILFQLLNTIVHTFTNNYVFMMFVTALIIQVLMFKTVRGNSRIVCIQTGSAASASISGKNVFIRGGNSDRQNDYSLTLLFFFFTVAMANIFFIRATVAIMINLYSVKYIKQKSFLKFALATLLAMGFHTSSVVFAIAYFVYHVRLQYRTVLIISAILCVVLVAFGKELIIFAGNILGGRFETYADEYLDIGYGTEFMESDNIFSVVFYRLKGIANNIFLLICFLIAYSYGGYKKDKHFKGLMKIYTFGMFIFIGLLMTSVLIGRFVESLLSMQYFLMLYFLLSFKGRTKKLVFFVFAIYLGVRLYSSLINYEEVYFPFNFVWGQQ